MEDHSGPDDEEIDLQVNEVLPPLPPPRKAADTVIDTSPCTSPRSLFAKVFESSCIEDTVNWKTSVCRSEKTSVMIQAHDRNTGAVQSLEVDEEYTLREVLDQIEKTFKIPRKSLVLIAQDTQDQCLTSAKSLATEEKVDEISNEEKEDKRSSLTSKWRSVRSSMQEVQNFLNCGRSSVDLSSSTVVVLEKKYPWDSVDGVTLPAIREFGEKPNLYFYRSDTAVALAQNKQLPWYEFLQHTPLCRMSFDGFSLTETESINLTARMAQNLKIPNILKKSIDDLSYFIYDVCELMHNCDYHNLNHVVDVTQCVYVTLCGSRMLTCIQPIEIAALFFAALCHDLDHPGYSNAFVNNEEKDVSIRYKQESPLENHSVACYRELCQKHLLLYNLSQEDALRFDTLVELLILRTDMTKHASLLRSANVALSLEEDITAHHQEVKDEKENRIESIDDYVIDLMLSLTLKCADISNQARPWPIASRWNAAVYQEFWKEGDADMERGRKPNPIHVRAEKMLKEDVAQKTTGFIHFVVRPLYDTLKNIIVHCADTQPHCSQLSPRVIAEAINMLDTNLHFYRLEADGLHLPHNELADRPGICGPHQLKLEYQRYERTKVTRRRSSVGVPLPDDDSYLLLIGDNADAATAHCQDDDDSSSEGNSQDSPVSSSLQVDEETCCDDIIPTARCAAIRHRQHQYDNKDHLGPVDEY